MNNLKLYIEKVCDIYNGCRCDIYNGCRNFDVAYRIPVIYNISGIIYRKLITDNIVMSGVRNEVAIVSDIRRIFINA